MPTFNVPGAQLACEFSDEGGHPVVQLHGLTSSRNRDRVLNLDLGRGLSGTRLLRYDARGHGLSTGRPVASDYRWSVLADDLLRLLDHWFPGEKVHAVGQSMGTGTILHAAVRDPERFDGLTLMLPPTAWETRSAKAEEYRESADLIASRGVQAFIEAGRDIIPPPATVLQPSTVPDMAEELLPWAFRGAAMSDLPDPDDIALIDIPVTILAWTHDLGHPVSTAATLVETLPHATLTVVSAPDEVNEWPSFLAFDVARHDEPRSRQHAGEAQAPAEVPRTGDLAHGA